MFRIEVHDSEWFRLGPEPAPVDLIGVSRSPIMRTGNAYLRISLRGFTSHANGPLSPKEIESTASSVGIQLLTLCSIVAS